MLVKSILKAKARGAGVVTISPSAPIGEAARELAKHRIGALIAVDAHGAPVGMLSERDIVRGLAAQGDHCLKALVSDLMSAPVVTCREDEPLEAVMQIMTERRIRHLPVLGTDGVLAGIVTIGDAVKSRLDEANMEVDNLRHYVVAAR